MLAGLLAVFCLAVGPVVHAETRAECDTQYKPETGQPGKDVVWVPTNDALVMRMLQMAQVKPHDLVYDLGAGDGKIAIAAAKHFGARAVGVEYNPRLAQLGQCYARAEGMSEKVRIMQADIFTTDFIAANVVTLYLLPDLNLRLRPTLLKMKPGTRVVSHSFLMDDWEPDERSMTEDGHAYLWIVPAQAAGRWVFRPQGEGEPITVHLEQTFQQLTGVVGDKKQAIQSATLRGAHLQLAFEENGAPVTLSGEVQDERIEAQVTRAGKTNTYIGERR